MKVPYKSSEGILHAVTEKKFQLASVTGNKPGNIIIIIKHYLIGVGDIWAESAFSDFS